MQWVPSKGHSTLLHGTWPSLFTHISVYMHMNSGWALQVYVEGRGGEMGKEEEREKWGEQTD